MGIFNSKKTSDLKDEGKDEIIDLNKDKKVSKKKEDATKEEKTEKSMKDLYAEENLKSDKGNANNSIAYRVLIRPAVTEKATDLGTLNKYVFIISDKANKIDVAKAISEVYGVKPISVNIIKIKGKKVNRGKVSGKRKDFKKAIVTLKKGETISVYEGV